MTRLPRELLALVDEQAAQYQQLEKWQRSAIVDILRENREFILYLLKKAKEDGLRAQHARVLAFLAELVSQNAVDLLHYRAIALANAFAAMGGDHAKQQLLFWGEHYNLEFRGLDMKTLIARRTSASLIRKHPRSMQRWGQEVENYVRAAFTGMQAAKFTWSEMAGHLNASFKEQSPQQEIPMAFWRAMRIVRTESSQAYNEAHFNTLRAWNEQNKDSQFAPNAKKTLVIVDDARTAADSRRVNGQVRELHEFFDDGRNPPYLHPPARPNDREREVAFFSPPPGWRL